MPSRKWKQHTKISKSSIHGDAFSSARAIAFHESGIFAVVDDIEHAEPWETGSGFDYSNRPRVYGLREDGSQQFVLNSTGTHENPVGVLHQASDVVVTKQGHFAVADNTTEVKLFNVKGQQVGSFSISNSGKQEERARCIAVNTSGEI